MSLETPESVNKIPSEDSAEGQSKDMAKYEKNSEDLLAEKCKKCVKFFIPIILFISLIAVLIWDMHKVKEMSDIIHDDHRDIWEQMNVSALNAWFTPLDLCMLKVDKAGVDLKSFRYQNCSKYPGGRGVIAQKLFCGIGSSLGKPCSTPLSSKIYFTSRLRKDGLGNPNSGTLKRALRRIAKTKKPLVFLGDALSKQNQDALLCEILRTDRVWATGNIYGSPNTSISNFTIHWKDGTNKLDVVFMHMAHIFVNGGSASASHDHAYDNDQNYHKENSDFSDWKHSGEGLRHLHKNSSSGVYGKEYSSLTLDEVKYHLNDMLQKYRGFVIIANVGVWYNTRERFRHEVPELLRLLSEVGTHNLVLFRETAAQHWNHTEHGYFSNGGSPDSGSCAPLADSTPEFDWRNRDVRLIIENEALENIHLIPFRDITAPLSDMHPEGPDVKDCTRFCYFPQMWQSVWWTMDTLTYNCSRLYTNTPVNTTLGHSKKKRGLRKTTTGAAVQRRRTR